MMRRDMTARRGLPALLGAAAALVAGPPASAHIIAPAYSLFDNGALHAVVTLQLAVPQLALGLALGSLVNRRAAYATGAAFVVALAAAAGFWTQTDGPVTNFATPLAFLAAGAALMAVTSRLAPWLIPLAAALVGASAGRLARLERPPQDANGVFVLGVCVGAGLVAAFAALALARYRRPWLTIPARIAASWLLAVGLMFLGLALRPVPAAAPDDGLLPTATCNGPHKHGPDGEFICLAVPGAGLARQTDAPPDMTDMAGPRRGPATNPQ